MRQEPNLSRATGRLGMVRRLGEVAYLFYYKCTPAAAQTGSPEFVPALIQRGPVFSMHFVLSVPLTIVADLWLSSEGAVSCESMSKG